MRYAHSVPITQPPASISPGRVAVAALVRFRPARVGMGVLHLMFGRYRLTVTPGLTFFKVLGSGRDGGFLPMPGLDHQGLFCAFDSEGNADRFLERSPALAFYRDAGADLVTMKLSAFSSRGTWSGVQPLAETAPSPIGPVVSLTRASIKPMSAAAFWRFAPASQVSLHEAQGCLLSVGLGEAPLLRQATFTMWKSDAAMNAYARSGAHLDAIRAANRHQFFSESMFTRFVARDIEGSWKGTHFGERLTAAHQPSR